jgi:hypothetical protein
VKSPFLSVVDSFIPESVAEAALLTRLRGAIVQCWLGVLLTAIFGLLYSLLGSPLSGASILFVMVGLVAGPSLIK